MNPATGLCVGCARTIDEVTRWPTMSNEEKEAIWRLLAERASVPRDEEEK